MKITKPNLGKGFLRLYLAAWSIGFSILVIDSYKEMVTALGSNYWLAEEVRKREQEKCLEKVLFETTNDKNKKITRLDMCEIYKESLNVSDSVSKNESDKKTHDVLIIGIVLPAIFGVFLFAIFRLTKWVAKGFVS